MNTEIVTLDNQENIMRRFLLFCIINSAVIFSTQYLLFDDSVYYNTLNEYMTNEKIDDLIGQQKKWQWLTYFLMPVLYLLKFLLISGCIQVGTMLFNYKTTFKSILLVVIAAEYVFVIPMIGKIIWFLLFESGYGMKEISSFSMLSAIQLFENGSVPSWLNYPLQTLNVFEIIYCLVLVKGISIAIQQDYSTAIRLIISSYVLPLILWVAIIMFLSINLTSNGAAI